MDNETKDRIAAFVKERDSVLLSGELEKVKTFFAKHNPHYVSEVLTKSDDALEAAMHKAITGALSLPLDYRRKSKQWLSDKGMSSMDEGDL